VHTTVFERARPAASVVSHALSGTRQASFWLDEDHPVLLRDRRGREVQQRREGAEEQIDLVLGDELGVVGDDRVLVARVVGDLELDLATEQAAVGVDLVAPDLVPLAGLATGLGEVTGQRQGDADDDRVLAVARARALHR